jgi:hypothetical protein
MYYGISGWCFGMAVIYSVHRQVPHRNQVVVVVVLVVVPVLVQAASRL